MNLFTSEDLELLAQHREERCISMFMPLKRGGPQKRTSEIRLKNHIQEAEKWLEQEDLRPGEIEEILEPARKLLNDMPFLEHDADGLAVFIAHDLFRYYRVPVELPSVVVVSDEFHVKPFIPLLTEDGRYFVLAISANDVRLLQCTRFSTRTCNLKDTPTSLEEFGRFDQVQRHEETHAARPGGWQQGKGGVMYHTQADDSDRRVWKENMRQFLSAVQNGVKRVLGDQKVPLVLAGVEEIRSIYREVNAYGRLLEEAVDGNPDRLKDADLQAAGWRLVEPEFQRLRQEAVGAYRQLSGTDRTLNSLDRVVQAAEQGVVQVLLADLEREQWGTVDPETSLVDIHTEEQPGDEDLVNHAALHTLLHGGRVFALPSEEMPDGDLAAAILRY